MTEISGLFRTPIHFNPFPIICNIPFIAKCILINLPRIHRHIEDHVIGQQIRFKLLHQFQQIQDSILCFLFVFLLISIPVIMPKQRSLAVFLVNMKDNISVRHIQIIATGKQPDCHQDLLSVKQIRQIWIRRHMLDSMSFSKRKAGSKENSQHWFAWIMYKMPAIMLEHKRSVQLLGFADGNHRSRRQRDRRQPALCFFVCCLWIRG
mmetsp:Transcript_39228/g.62667  ORF Transcript_39228/g.62667 Transcript_39228/m.62667 type:complete len:207 (-) Transcript_39228:101-721(-)